MRGHESLIGEFPSLVSLQYRTYTYNSSVRYTHKCGGVIIDPVHILTAAHCTFDSKMGPKLPKYWIAVAGDTSIDLVESNFRSNLRPRLLFVHPYFKRSLKIHDIAIFRLEEPVKFMSQVIAAAPLPEEGAPEGTVCKVAGWGQLHELITRDIKHQRNIEIPILPDINCQQAYGPFMRNELKFCAGYSTGGADICRGDYGGGLFCNGSTVYGIASYGFGCGRPYYPGVYTNVTTYLPWIDWCLRYTGDQKGIPMPQWKYSTKMYMGAALTTQAAHEFVFIAILGFLNLIWLIFFEVIV